MARSDSIRPPAGHAGDSPPDEDRRRPDQHHRGRFRRQRGPHPRGHRRRPRGAEPSSWSRRKWRCPATRPRTSSSATTSATSARPSSCAWRPTRPASPWWSATRTARGARATTPPPCFAAARIEAIYFKQQPAQLQRLRREALLRRRRPRLRLRGGGAAHRAHDLRGPVVPAGRGPGEGGGRGTPALDQRLALPPQQARRALPGDGRAREGDGAAAPLRALGGRAGRAGLRRRLLRVRRGRHARLPGRDLPRVRGPRGLRGRPPGRARRAAAHGGGDDLPRARDGRARLRGQEPLSGRAHRAVGRHRLGARGRDLRRRPRGRSACTP